MGLKLSIVDDDDDVCLLSNVHESEKHESFLASLHDNLGIML